MQAIILDTETHTLNGLPIEIAYAPIEIEHGKLSLDKKKIFNECLQNYSDFMLHVGWRNSRLETRSYDKNMA